MDSLRNKLFFLTGPLLVVAAVALWSFPRPSRAVATAEETNLIASIVNAPVVPDGNAAGRVTDVVINFNVSMNPADPGLTFLEGRQIRVTLPEDFVNHGALPTLSIFADADPAVNCRPGNLQCNTTVLLRGWPQSALGLPPPPTGYSVELEGTHTLVITANEDFIPAPPADPGLKQIHLILLDFTNPGPGYYPIDVEAELGPGGSLLTDTGTVRIYPNPRAHVGIASAFSGGGNTIYQQADPGEPTPLPFDFLLWDSAGAPYLDVQIVQRHDRHAELRHGGRVVGQITIDAPRGARGQRIEDLGPSFAALSPALLVPTGRLQAQFTAGDSSGRYTMTLRMNNGSEVQTFVDVP